ncbi:MAG TPA: hypothetical protein VM536_10190 [Chloroflexia bacterium]|nr:hypothetical protein [Chloroflexia bacterium]
MPSMVNPNPPMAGRLGYALGWTVYLIGLIRLWPALVSWLFGAPVEPAAELLALLITGIVMFAVFVAFSSRWKLMTPAQAPPVPLVVLGVVLGFAVLVGLTGLNLHAGVPQAAHTQAAWTLGLVEGLWIASAFYVLPAISRRLAPRDPPVS